MEDTDFEAERYLSILCNDTVACQKISKQKTIRISYSKADLSLTLLHKDKSVHNKI